MNQRKTTPEVQSLQQNISNKIFSIIAQRIERFDAVFGLCHEQAALYAGF